MSESRAFVYLLEGPSGVYVGCTTDPEKRRAQHWRCARVLPERIAQPVHHAMNRDGAGAWSMRIVACARSAYDGRSIERGLVKSKLNAQADDGQPAELEIVQSKARSGLKALLKVERKATVSLMRARGGK